MDWRIELDPEALGELSRLDPSIQRRVIGYLRECIGKPEDPRRSGRALRGNLQNLWRYRIGDFRLICDIRDDRGVVVVLGVGHRKDVYE